MRNNINMRHIAANSANSAYSLAMGTFGQTPKIITMNIK